MTDEEHIKKLQGDLSLAQAELHQERETYNGGPGIYRHWPGVYRHFRDMVCYLIASDEDVQEAIRLEYEEHAIDSKDLEYRLDDLESKVEDIGYITDDFDQDTLTENITDNVVSSTEFKDEVSETIRRHLNNLEVTLINHN